MEAVAKARVAAGLPALRPDGSPYVRGPYKPRAPKGASAAGGGKEGQGKPGRQPRQPDQKVQGSACYVFPHVASVQVVCNCVRNGAKLLLVASTAIRVRSSVLVAPCFLRVWPHGLAAHELSADASRLDRSRVCRWRPATSACAGLAAWQMAQTGPAAQAAKRGSTLRAVRSRCAGHARAHALASHTSA